MKTADKQQAKINKKESERGSALVLVLLISFLLLVVAGGLIFAASMHTANVTDAVAEEQAYSAAESGLQSAINVLRGNVAPNPLLDSSKPASDPANKITYRRAVKTTLSNRPNDSSGLSRMSRWMSYHQTFSDRIALTNPNAYTAFNDLAFNVSVADADNGNAITFYTTGKINGVTAPYQIGSGSNRVEIEYNSVTQSSPTTINVSSGAANTSLGSFTIRTFGTGATLQNDIRFTIVLKMTAPYGGSRAIRGFIKAGTINSNSVGTVKIDFDSNLYELSGSTITLANDPLTLNPSNTNGGVTQINANITQGEPRRLLLRSTGFGPRGAEKQLEAIIRKDLFDGLYAPATITLVGAQNGFDFDAGNSNAFTYSGADLSSNMMIPPVGVAVPGLNVDAWATDLRASNGNNLIGVPGDISDELPDWLSSAAELHKTLRGVDGLRQVAEASGGYYPAGVTPTSFGNNATGQGITFVDGNVRLSGAGGGILVCTGKLTLDGGFDFKGLIIVTGADGVVRNGSGNGRVYGNIVVAPYTQTTSNNITTYSFLGPKYDMNGGGNSLTRFDSNSISNGLLAVDNIVVGVAEK